MLFDKIEYLGGLPYPFNVVGKLSIEVDYGKQLVVFKSDQILALPKLSILDVRTNIIQSRSVGKAVLGYCIGDHLHKKYGGLIGGAIGGKRKDVSELYIDYNINKQTKTVILRPGNKTWDLYAAIQSLII
jgi:hypothetical protein